MSDKTPQIIQYIPYQAIEEDEISLKEIIKTILKYKKFIIIFTLILTFLAGLYAFLKTSVYEIKATLETGYMYVNNKDTMTKRYFIEPETLVVYINDFDNSNNKKKFPEIKTNLQKNTENLLIINIRHKSNKLALTSLNKILYSINQKENKQIDILIKTVQKKINILNQQLATYNKLLNYLNYQLKSSNNLQTILTNIQDIQDKITKVKIQITNLQQQISPINIQKTHIIGKITKHDYPIKPKKKLIITVAFITGLILSIFLVFLIEFIKGLKEE